MNPAPPPPSEKSPAVAPPQASSPGTFWFTAPRHSAGRSVAIILGLIVAIAALDYLAGFWVSMQLFYLLPIGLTVSWLGWRAGCATAILCVAARLGGDIAAGIFAHVQPPTVYWNRLAELSISFILVWALQSLISLHRELERRVQERTAALKNAVAARDELQKQLFEVSRRERTAIGRDLHDGLGQHLTATSMAATVLASRLSAAANSAAEDARRVVQLIQHAIATTRDIARGLLLAAVEPADLVFELGELADRVRKEHNVACNFTARGEVHGLNVAASSHLFYIAQEAARNAARHARPSRIKIALVIETSQLELTVADNGIGIAAQRSDGGMGLRIMTRRSELIGAHFSVITGAHDGTTVRCLLPLPAPASPTP